MLARLGFVGPVLTEGITSSRTCRLKNATPLRLRELIADNLAALDRTVSFLERHRILLYRISSDVVPFGSHPVNVLRWWEDFSADLHALGARFRGLGIRVSMHPGQFTVLNSPNPAVVSAAIADLEYHARLLDALGADASSRLVLHIGGRYAGTDSEARAAERFYEVASSLDEAIRRRLVVENDDKVFDADEVCAVARRLNVPVVFDWLHHQANPCRTPLAEVLPAIFETWKVPDGRPKVHLSSQAAGGPPGAHANAIDPDDALAMCAAMPPRPFDCMLEAKEKDRALLALRSDLGRRGVLESDLLGNSPTELPASGG